MNKTERIKRLTEQVLKASITYYKNDNLIMTDKQYDDLYDELVTLEKETGVVLAGSPTQKVQGYILDEFKKVRHDKLMLSAAKTKDVSDIKKFISNNDFYCSYKLDGLTLVVKYKNGKFIQGITRGDGEIGEDVTEQCRFISNLPMEIPNKNSITLRGECVISYDEFNRINKMLEKPYEHPRNLAAGTLRNLDLNIIKERKLSFVVFEMVSPTFTYKLDGLNTLPDMGFETVGRCVGEIANCIEAMQPEYCIYPVDGLIFELNNSELSKSLGVTSHHENCRIAMKWEDELYETILTGIEWNTSKSGLINPIAIFEPVNLDGATTTRATLHNVSYIEDLQLGTGDTIQVYRANMVIPKVHDNLSRSNTWKVPDKCPSCGGDVEIRNENGSKTLHCCNNLCAAKLLGKLNHFCSKNAINIEDMSEATLEFLINKDWVTRFDDLYHLDIYADEWISNPGFGKKSVDKLLGNIQKSKNTTLDRFIYSLSIPLIGRTASKTISKYLNESFEDFYDKWINNYNWSLLDDFGSTMNDSMNNFIRHNCLWIRELANEFTFEKKTENNKSSDVDLSGKIFVITGSVNCFKNRDELKELIESLGGKVSGSVSAKTSFLINNDSTSNSGKNKKAFELKIPIITEEEFVKMISK